MLGAPLLGFLPKEFQSMRGRAGCSEYPSYIETCLMQSTKENSHFGLIKNMSSKNMKHNLTPRIRRARGGACAQFPRVGLKTEEHSKYPSFTVPCRADIQGDRDKTKRKKKENQTSGQHQLDLPGFPWIIYDAVQYWELITLTHSAVKEQLVISLKTINMAHLRALPPLVRPPLCGTRGEARARAHTHRPTA